MAKIDKRLNLVVPVERDGGTIYVHSTPISKDVFEAHYRVLAKAFTEIYQGGLNVTTGPRVAYLVLRDAARAMDIWEGPEGVEATLVAEIKRLTNVVLPGPNGWAPIPYEEAVAKGLLSEDEIGEVENAIAFFIVASSVHKRAEVGPIVTQAARLWGGQITSSNSTEFAASLPTSTGAGSSGARAAA